MKKRFSVLAFMVAAVAAVVISAGSAQAQSAPPVANAGGPYTGVVGQSIQLNGAASAGTNLRFSWNFGNGFGSTAVSPTTTYTVAGTYPISLTVTDSLGRQSTDTTVVRIVNFAPVVAPVAAAVPVGCTVIANGIVCPGAGFVGAPFCPFGFVGVGCTFVGTSFVGVPFAGAPFFGPVDLVGCTFSTQRTTSNCYYYLP